MNLTYLKNVNITGLRNCKIFFFNNKLYLLGSKKYNSEGSIIKYLVYCYELNDNFDIITENILDLKFLYSDYFDNINISSWIRNIYVRDNFINFIIEIKTNENNKKLLTKYYLLKTNDFFEYNILQKYNLDNKYLLWNEYRNNLFMSKTENTDEFNWGQYSFNFKINNNMVKPIFDKYIDYNKFQGHIIHNIYENFEEPWANILFSIRHKTDEYFIYKVYTATTSDYIYYFNTKEVSIDNFDKSWICYPNRFEYKNNFYIICNVDDFGKNTSPIILKINNDN